ncbi:MAG: hypothetical protein WDO69_22460 [Pseudomonadota bacterium]
MKLALALGLITLTFAACSGRRLPPGTPPPEYEPPTVTPWPVESADAGGDAAARNDAEAPSLPTHDPELSLDAGPR